MTADDPEQVRGLGYPRSLTALHIRYAIKPPPTVAATLAAFEELLQLKRMEVKEALMVYRDTVEKEGGEPYHLLTGGQEGLMKAIRGRKSVLHWFDVQAAWAESLPVRQS